MTIIGYNRNFVPLACIGAAQKSLEETMEYLTATLGRGTHICLARQMPPTGKGLGAIHRNATAWVNIASIRIMTRRLATYCYVS